MTVADILDGLDVPDGDERRDLYADSAEAYGPTINEWLAARERGALSRAEYDAIRRKVTALGSPLTAVFEEPGDEIELIRETTAGEAGAFAAKHEVAIYEDGQDTTHAALCGVPIDGGIVPVLLCHDHRAASDGTDETAELSPVEWIIVLLHGIDDFARHRTERRVVCDGGSAFTDLDDDREARERGRYLDATTDLTEREAHTVAYSEMGFSASGTANRTGYAEGSIERYLERTAVKYGHEAIVPKTADERDGTLVEVTREEVFEYPEGTREWWLSTAADHPDMAPDWARERLGLDTETARNGRGR